MSNGTRSRGGPAARRPALTALLPLALYAAAAAGCGDSASVCNRTPYYLHVTTEVDSNLYLPPHGCGDVDVGADLTIHVLVSPGQTADGAAQVRTSCCEGDCGSYTVTWSGGLEIDGHRGECPHSSCPYVYSHDGRRFVLEAEALTGALHRGARRTDLVPLPSLRETGGRYAVRVTAELDETDTLDDVRLVLVDRPADLEVVADASGATFAVARTVAPGRVVDAAGADRTADLAAAGGGSWLADDGGRDVDGEPRDWVVLEFPRPASAREAVLLLRGRTTLFVEEALHAYLDGYGSAMPTLLRVFSWLPTYRSYVDRWLAVAGMQLEPALQAAGGDWTPLAVVRSSGRAAPRTTAVRFALPPDAAEVVRVRLAALPGSWELDEVRLAVPVAVPLPTWRLPPSGSRLTRLAEDVGLDAVGSTHDLPATLRQGRALTLVFDAAPPADGLVRSAFLELTGYYTPRTSGLHLDLDGRRWLERFSSARPFADFVLARLRAATPP